MQKEVFSWGDLFVGKPCQTTDVAGGADQDVGLANQCSKDREPAVQAKVDCPQSSRWPAFLINQ
jgi:hypothetical protein